MPGLATNGNGRSPENPIRIETQFTDLDGLTEEGAWLHVRVRAMGVPADFGVRSDPPLEFVGGPLGGTNSGNGSFVSSSARIVAEEGQVYHVRVWAGHSGSGGFSAWRVDRWVLDTTRSPPTLARDEATDLRLSVHKALSDDGTLYVIVRSPITMPAVVSAHTYREMDVRGGPWQATLVRDEPASFAFRLENASRDEHRVHLHIRPHVAYSDNGHTETFQVDWDGHSFTSPPVPYVHYTNLVAG